MRNCAAATAAALLAVFDRARGLRAGHRHSVLSGHAQQQHGRYGPRNANLMQRVERLSGGVSIAGQIRRLSVLRELIRTPNRGRLVARVDSRSRIPAVFSERFSTWARSVDLHRWNRVGDDRAGFCDPRRGADALEALGAWPGLEHVMRYCMVEKTNER